MRRITALFLICSFLGVCGCRERVVPAIPDITKSITAITESNMTPEQKAQAIAAVQQLYLELYKEMITAWTKQGSNITEVLKLAAQYLNVAATAYLGTRVAIR